jgi:predicted NUDIX family NTP pyrophosphohydrolase
MYRRREQRIEVLLVHPGGPLFHHKDDGHWSIPKGENEPGETLLETAQREFIEETGLIPTNRFHDLGEVKRKSGNPIRVWAVYGDIEPAPLPPSRTVSLEWPPGSGQSHEVPEIDCVRFFDLDTAWYKIRPVQRPFLDRLESFLTASGPL